jgi:pimeloyl-ACP methyl ester carboxylesterase
MESLTPEAQAVFTATYATVAPAQIEAIQKWGARRAAPFGYLRDLTQPVLVINGGNDVISYTVNSFLLQQNLPNAELIVYPDANHGSHYQYPALFVADVLQARIVLASAEN